MGREAVYQIADRFGGLEEIWIVGRRQEKLDEFDGMLPTRVRKFAVDLMAESGMAALREALETFRPNVKMLVNAAGCGKTGPITDSSPEDSRRMIRLNCEALTAVTELVLPYLSANSRIIQFASSAAFLPQPGFAVYAATKSYVYSYSHALAAELAGRDIYVTIVCPGPVDTEFFDYALDGKPIAGYKKLVMAKPDAVVKQAVTDSMMGKPVSIYGLPMKAFYVLTRLVPDAWIMKFIRW